MKLFVYGSGGSGRECMDIARRVNVRDGRWDEILFLDDFRQEIFFYNARVFSFDTLRQSCTPEHAEIVITLGEPGDRAALREKTVSRGYHLATVIDPSAYISSSAQFGAGVVVAPMCVITSDVVISDNVYVNSACSLSHDCRIMSDAVISPHVSISGHVCIGNRSYVGVGSTIKNSITIGDDVIIGAGSVVVKNIQDSTIAMGSPCTVRKENIEHKVFRQK